MTARKRNRTPFLMAKRTDKRKLRGQARRAAWVFALCALDDTMDEVFMAGHGLRPATSYGCPDDDTMREVFADTLEAVRKYVAARSKGHYAPPPGGVGVGVRRG